MNNPKLTSKEQKQKDLLKKYEPVLNFSAKERFFPMNVYDYIDECELRLNKKPYPCNDEWKKKKQQLMDEYPKYKKFPKRAKGDALQFFNEGMYYLRFVHEFEWLIIFSRLYRTFSIVILVGIIWYGMLQQDGKFLPPLEGLDNINVGILALFFFLWTFFRADRKLSFALVLNIFALQYFGKDIGFGFGMLAVVIIVSFWVVFFIQKIGFKRCWPPVVTNLTSFIVILTLTFPTGIGVISLMDNRIADSARGIILFLLFLTVMATFLWFPIGYFVSRFGNKYGDEFFDEEWKPSIVLTISILCLGIAFLICSGLGLERTMTFTILIILAATAGLWHFLDPLPIARPAPDASNQSETQDSWNGRILSFITLGIVIWVGGSMWYMNIESVHKLTLFYLVGIVNLVITFGLLGGNVVGFLLDIASLQSDTVVFRAVRKYRKKGKQKQNYYYGRVCRGNGWTALQYHYFYAFNDWRSIANGFNNHEGDWEAVAVFLKHGERKAENCNDDDLIPYGVAYSQHHNGVFCFWDEVKPPDACHPQVYVALGSHANYSKKGTYEASAQFTGLMHRIVFSVDSFIRWFRGGGLPEEVAEGDGARIGEGEAQSWICEIIDDNNTGWVKYKGLWGKKTTLKDESGPTGPKWKRLEEQEDEQGVRPRWMEWNEQKQEWDIERWKDILLFDMVYDKKLSLKTRERALHDLDTIPYRN